MTYNRIKGTHTYICRRVYVYTFTIHHRLRSNDVNDEHTKKRREKVCDGSDIFTQLLHTNQTTEVHARIKNKHWAVKRAI